MTMEPGLMTVETFVHSVRDEVSTVSVTAGAAASSCETW